MSDVLPVRAQCFAPLLMTLLFSTSLVQADTGRIEADRLCEKAEVAERAAGDAEKKSQERRKFLKAAANRELHKDNTEMPNVLAIRQSVGAELAKAKEILPQIRQGIDAAGRDRGIVPGLSQYFSQMEKTVSQLLQAGDSCLQNPESCRMPVVACPQPPPLPAFNNIGSADLVRNVQQSYSQAANQAWQACRNLNGGMLKEIERLKRESRSVTIPKSSQAASTEIDLQAKRAESLKREAAQYRQEADRLALVTGYCAARSTRTAAGLPQGLVGALRSATYQAPPAEAEFRPDAVVIDLKTSWQRKWDQGKTLKAPHVPLPKLSVAGGEKKPFKEDETGADDGPGWWSKAKAAYKRGDEQVELTEFIKSRPKELVKDVVKELIEMNMGSAGKTLTTGYSILSAVKSTSDEVGGILMDAPRAIASANPDEARELLVRTERVPLNFLNSIFDDVTGKFPPPRYNYQYKGDGQ
jgi:hypothetical protein